MRRQQAINNSKAQFANSPDLKTELQNLIVAYDDAHTALSTQALKSPHMLVGLLEILLNRSTLWKQLRSKAAN